MPLLRPTAIALAALAVVLVLGGVVPSSRAETSTPQACNLRGSWVANTAEANRYMTALNPTASTIHLTHGALSATFTRTTFTFGGLSLGLVAQLGQSTLREVIDIEAVAPYRVRGSRLALGRGTYKIHYVSAKLTRSGRTTALHLPNSAISTPASSVPYSCTPRVLHLAVAPGGSTDSVSLALRRD
jgi:hypothetical protein